MMGEFIWAKEYIEHNDREFRHQMKRDNKKFIQKTKDELHAKGFRHQELIHKRHDAIEAELARQQKLMDQNASDIEHLTIRLTREYDEWQRHRKRWKGDFMNAYTDTEKKIDEIRQEFNVCVTTAENNQRAIKMVLDASMIQHLIQN